MKKLLLLLFCFIFLFELIHAQEYTITLSGQKLKNALQNLYIRDVTLVQQEDSCLGIITQGMVKKVTPVYFEKNIKNEIKDFMMYSMPEKGGTDPAILRINRFYLHEIRKHDNLFVCLELSVTFITLKDSVFSEDFTAGVTPTKLFYEADLTLPSLIVEAFDQCFTQYAERLKKGWIVPLRVNQQQAKENPLIMPGHNECTIHKERIKGIYLSFYDFRDGLVDTTFHFTIHHNYNNDNPDLTTTWLKYKGKSPPNDIWGFSDGDGDFIKVGRSFCRLTLDSNIFHAHTRSAEYAEDITSSAVFGGILFGVVGAAVFGGLTAATADSKYLIKTKVDFFYGKLVPFETGNYTKISSTLIFYYSKLSEKGVTVSVYVDDQLQCVMPPHSFLTLDLSCRHPQAKIRLVASNGATSEEEIPLKLTKTKVYLVKVKDEKNLLFNQLHDQMKRDMLHERETAKTRFVVDLR
jgi:hypothetical protein